MSTACFKLEYIPDLSLNKYQSLADNGIDGVLKRHENFLRQWHGICIEGNASFHLIYAYVPNEPIGHRLSAFFLIQSSGNDLGLIEPLLVKSPLSDFFTLSSCSLPAISFSSGATMVKKERIAEIYNPMTGQYKSVHYVPTLEMNNKCRLYDLFRIMETVSQAYSPAAPCAFRVDLYPVSLSSETRNKLSPLLKELRGENDIKLMHETDSVKADSYAKDICKEYEDWITSVDTTPHFRVNMYAFSDSEFKAKVLLKAASSEALNEGDFAIASIKPDANGRYVLDSRMGKTPNDYCFYPSRAALPSWSTTFCLPEVVPFFRLPVLYDGETIELPKETAPVHVDDGIYLGKDTNGYPVNLPLSALPRHAFFTGMPGSGKTNTMLHLASMLKKKGIPFLAMEPAKKEYRALLGNEDMSDIYLFSPHLQSKFPLQMNPLEFPTGVRLSEHINALLEVFEGTFMLEGPTYKFLSSAIQRAYIDHGWDIEDVNTPNSGKVYPSLQDVYDNLEHEVNASSYDAELKGNVRAFLQVRLGGLMERDAGELYNVKQSTLRPNEWISVSAIVELEVLAEHAKNFFVLLVCHYILETLRVDPSGGHDENGNVLPVRHVVFIEEAHNIIAPSTQQMAADSINPKISATAYIIKMLAEVRALREAIVIADQLPTALASEVVKNTGLKLVHRLTAQDDREQIGSAISASPLQLERMASFSTGRTYIYHEDTKRPFEMQVAAWKSPELAIEISSDNELYNFISMYPTTIRSITVAFWNWQEKYLDPVSDALQILLTEYMDSSSSADTVRCVAQKEDLMQRIHRLETQCERFRTLWGINAHCAHPLQEEFSDVLAYIAGMKERVNLIQVIM